MSATPKLASPISRIRAYLRSHNKMQLTAWILIGLLACVTGWLAWQNRASEKIAVTFPTAVAVGLVGTLVTLLFSIQSEKLSARFPVEYVLDPTSRLPLRSEAFPEVTRYTDAGGTTVVPAWSIVGDLGIRNPESAVEIDDSTLLRTYRAILVRQMLDMLRIRFYRDWNAQASRFKLPTSGIEVLGLPGEENTGTRITNAQLVAAFGGDTFYAHPQITDLNLPPSTALSALIGGNSTVITLTNDFVTVTITIADRNVEKGVGELRTLCKLTFEDAAKPKRPRFLVTLEASFNPVRSGHPKMSDMKQWVNTLFTECGVFDSQQRWEFVRDQYVLLYSNREKTEMQELMDEAKRKADKANPK